MSLDTHPTEANELRLKLRELTGRRDLIDADGRDNGIDFYINNGLRFLDDQLPVNACLSRRVYQVAASAYTITVQDARSIKDVWAYDEGNDNRIPMVKRDLNWLRSRYTQDWASLSTGVPQYYAINIDRLDPANWSTTTLSSSTYSDVADIRYGNAEQAYRLTGILFLPPSNGTYTFNVVGAFYSPRIEDSAFNFWTVNYPEALILAAQRSMEALLYRNPEGVKGYESALAPILNGIDYNAVETEMADIQRIDPYPMRRAGK